MLQDDPDVKIFNAQTEMKEFSEREGKIYARLGRQVYETDGGENYPEIRAELDLLAANKQAAESRPRTCRSENVPAGKPRSRSIAAPIAGPIIRREPTLPRVWNPFDATRATSACGETFLPNCGTEVIAGHRFCSGCGTKME